MVPNDQWKEKDDVRPYQMITNDFKHKEHESTPIPPGWLRYGTRDREEMKHMKIDLPKGFYELPLVEVRDEYKDASPVSKRGKRLGFSRRLANRRYRDSPVPLTGIRRRLANRRYRDSPVLLRLLEEIREANRRHQARERALERA